jgi:perosamine synthetase
MIPMAETTLAEPEIEAALHVLRSGQLRQGVECDRFEKAFADQVSARHAVTCANGSAALHLAYAAVFEPGDEILMPSFSFFATAGMALQTGLVPVLCDVDPKTYLIDLEDAARRLTSRTRGIVPVHLFGASCPVDAIESFAAQHSLRIVWDAAQSMGTRFNGRDIGSLGACVCYSFYPTKNLFVGEGGMVTSADPELDRKMRYLRTHGQTAKYVHTMVGWNYRMTDVEAAIGRAQLGRLETMLARRRQNAAQLNAGLLGLPGFELPAEPKGSESSWHQYSVVIDEKEMGFGRDALAERLTKKGVSTAVHYPRGIHQQPVIRERLGVVSLPVTERLTETILALPVHHGLGEEEIGRVIRAVREAVTDHGP